MKSFLFLPENLRDFAVVAENSFVLKIQCTEESSLFAEALIAQALGVVAESGLPGSRCEGVRALSLCDPPSLSPKGRPTGREVGFCFGYVPSLEGIPHLPELLLWSLEK